MNLLFLFHSTVNFKMSHKIISLIQNDQLIRKLRIPDLHPLKPNFCKLLPTFSTSDSSETFTRKLRGTLIDRVVNQTTQLLHFITEINIDNSSCSFKLIKLYYYNSSFINLNDRLP